MQCDKTTPSAYTYITVMSICPDLGCWRTDATYIIPCTLHTCYSNRLWLSFNCFITILSWLPAIIPPMYYFYYKSCQFTWITHSWHAKRTFSRYKASIICIGHDLPSQKHHKSTQSPGLSATNQYISEILIFLHIKILVFQIGFI